MQQAGTRVAALRQSSEDRCGCVMSGFLRLLLAVQNGREIKVAACHTATNLLQPFPCLFRRNNLIKEREWLYTIVAKNFVKLNLEEKFN